MTSRELVLSEPTSNPAVMRFLLGASAARRLQTALIGLVARIGQLEGVERALVSDAGSIAVHKGPDVSWEQLAPRVIALLEQVLLREHTRALPEATAGPRPSLWRWLAQRWRARPIVRPAPARDPESQRASGDAELERDRGSVDRELALRVQRLIEFEVGAYAHAHGARLELVSVQGGCASLRLCCACKDCPAGSDELRTHLSVRLRAAIPDITSIEIA